MTADHRDQNRHQQQRQQQLTTPVWRIENGAASFASIHVEVPPQTCVHCESDAVVTFTEGIHVKGVIEGGVFASLARVFFTQESFFTTSVENVNSTDSATVMMAPKDPGGIVLHELKIEDSNYDDLLLTSGSYIASDSSVRVTSEVQGGSIGNSMLSGTGFFLLRASLVGGSGSERQRRGYVACGAYGAVHKFVLGDNEIRAVDNGHLVAWTASMRYRVGLASNGGRRGGITSMGILDSITSGEGLMCFFEGPGTVYIQSHKADLHSSSSTTPQSRGGRRDFSRSSSSGSSCAGVLIFLLFIICFLWVFLSSVEFQNNQFGSHQYYYSGDASYHYKGRDQQRRSRSTSSSTSSQRTVGGGHRSSSNVGNQQSGYTGDRQDDDYNVFERAGEL